MKAYFTIAATALAFVSSASATSTDDKPCSDAEQGSAYTSMVGLLQGTALNTCATESGYGMLTSPSMPTAEQTAAMCKVDACHELIKSVLATNPPDCKLKIPTSGAVLNVKTLADDFEPTCTNLTTADAPVEIADTEATEGSTNAEERSTPIDLPSATSVAC